MNKAPLTAARDCICCQCRQPISAGSQFQWKRVTVRSHRDGAGRVWEKPAFRPMHWDCRPYSVAAARSLQIAGINEKIQLMRDVAPAGVSFFEDELLAVLST